MSGQTDDNWLVSVLRTAPVAIVGVDADRRVTTWNLGAAALVGRDEPAMRGEPIATVVAEPHRRAFAELLERAAGGETLRDRPSVWVTGTGTDMEVAVTLWPAGSESGDVAIVVREVTEERWLSSMLDGSLETLRGALDDARAAEARARRFLADVAHQLRTPITGIQASAEVLLRGPGGDPTVRDRLLGNIVHETARAGRLMKSMLRMARIDQGEPVHRAPVDIAALCENTIETFRVLAPDITFTVDTTRLDRPRPDVDAHAVEEILSNLLDNARRHARHRVTVTVSTSATGVELVVADDGPGLPPGREDDAFERFVNLDAAGGSGLGLAIARSRARAHGGDLRWTGQAFALQLEG